MRRASGLSTARRAGASEFQAPWNIVDLSLDQLPQGRLFLRCKIFPRHHRSPKPISSARSLGRAEARRSPKRKNASLRRRAMRVPLSVPSVSTAASL